ncbi:unnamed protein product [Phytomonas sp. Hart1]|nr:unnamed protein product [Phytomonas sp. Hart1]|eukprot:CCW71507.1 unnamed protein product [Phytomonas sp. isolate Hart1]
MKPRAALLRQQQSQNRRSKLEEIATMAQMESMRNPKIQQQRFAYPSSIAQRRDPNRGIITQNEWNELVDQHENSGRGFRFIFLIFVIASVILLVLSKYDAEFNVEVPQLESGRGFGEVLNPLNTDDSEPDYYQTLGVKGRLWSNSELNSDVVDSDADKQRRRENYRTRQEIKKSYQIHNDKQGQLVYCGRSCQAKNKQVQIAYNKLSSQVDRELFGVLLDAKDTKSARTVSPETLKKKYEEKREFIEKTETDEEDRAMALEELKDAYEIIQDPDARKYYLIYGAKPPEHMRHVSARHGGWGQEMALGTFKYRIIIMWLDFLNQYIGIWGETTVLLVLLIFLLGRIPQVLKQTHHILDDMEWHEPLGEMSDAEPNKDES